MTDLSDAQMAGWRAYIESSQRLLTRLEDELHDDAGLSLADYHVLVLLSEAPGRRLRMGQLADRLVFSPSRLTYQISAMQRRGLVVREACPRDRRGSEAVLTEAGLRALRDAAPHHLTSVRRHLMDHLDDAEVACLTRVFQRLGERLNTARPTPSDPPDPSGLSGHDLAAPGDRAAAPPPMSTVTSPSGGPAARGGSHS